MQCNTLYSTPMQCNADWDHRGRGGCWHGHPDTGLQLKEGLVVEGNKLSKVLPVALVGIPVAGRVGPGHHGRHLGPIGDRVEEGRSAELVNQDIDQE